METWESVMPKQIELSNDVISKIKDLYQHGSNRTEIAQILKVSEWAVRKTLNGFCRSKGESLSLHYKNNTVKLSYIQEQLIIGSLLGDASLSFRKERNSYELQVSHCLEQKQFLLEKANLLGVIYHSYIKDNSFSNGKRYFKLTYCNKYELKRIYDLCFEDGIKTITKRWCDKLGPIAISYWFMDDGTSSIMKNSSSVVVRFATLSFPKQQLLLLQDVLLRFGIETSLQKHNDGKGFIMAVRQKSVNNFMDLIEPYIVDCMKYKIKRRINEPNFRFSSKDIRSTNCLL
jgi:hypothetical protein